MNIIFKVQRYKKDKLNGYNISRKAEARTVGNRKR